MNHIAHINVSTDGQVSEHALIGHLKKVSALAGGFASEFNGQDWASLAGLWHDLGKYRIGFQRYIRQQNKDKAEQAHIENKVVGKEKTHSAAGALWAIQKLPTPFGDILAYLIASHHAGLYNWTDLEQRLNSSDSQKELQEALEAKVPTEILETTLFTPDGRSIPGQSAGFSLWVRMLFSCLVDADFLDTESFFDSGLATRRQGFPNLDDMLTTFNAYMHEKSTSASATHVNTIRADILNQCREKAKMPPGFFSLDVPTGGGKTLSSLAFALEHAKKYQKKRIIYAIPYTSIIEQTADVFRDAFKSLGHEVLIEHHSQADSEPEQETARSRLACENWDASLVVTTNVQLFESLFAAKTSRCRKLHNLVNSVIILDEAQQLPTQFLQPILDCLNLLVKHYGVSVVLCTATQPMLSSTVYFDARKNLRGLENVREIIEQPDKLHEALKRVSVELPHSWQTITSWESVASSLIKEDRVLCIVNTRNSAKELFKLMPEGTLHLSTRLCGAHRAEIIRQIKHRLQTKQDKPDDSPLRVISTQLVEAGVDLDFPVVWRALAGLDSIAQAAGRCNREGKLDKFGRVVVFIPPVAIPTGDLLTAANACKDILEPNEQNPLSRTMFKKYFTHFYYNSDTDQKRICELLKISGNNNLSVQFKNAAEAFKLIDDDGATVVVWYEPKRDEIDTLINTVKKDGPQRWLMRKLQRYMVTVRKTEAERMLQRGDVELPMPGLYVQAVDGIYDSSLGLMIDEIPRNPKNYMC